MQVCVKLSNNIENKADKQTNLFHNIIIIGQFTENLKKSVALFTDMVLK